MELVKALKIMRDLMDQNDLKDWSCAFDCGIRRFGRCSSDKTKITLSRKLTQVNTEERVIQTIIHEIAHARVGPGHNHDYVWKQECIKLGGTGVARWSDESTITVDRDYEILHNGQKLAIGDPISFTTGVVISGIRAAEGIFQYRMRRKQKCPMVCLVCGEKYKFRDDSIVSA